MITAIVNINAAVDRIPEVAQAIADLEGVTEVYSVAGDVDRGHEGEFVSQFVTVNGTDVGDIRLQMSTGSRVQGRIFFDGPGSEDPTRVAVATTSADVDLTPLNGRNASAAAGSDGTFVLDGLNGPRRLRVLRAPPSWSVKAIHANGRDITDVPLPFGTRDESLTNVEIVLTSKAASITGSVVDARGSVSSDYTIIVFATSTDRWFQGSRALAFTRPKADATFLVPDLPSGDYYVAAVDRMQGAEASGEWQDPAFLESIAPMAMRVTLSEGQTQSVTPRLIVR